VTNKIKTTKCPECGCEEFVNENLCGDGFRQCKECFQDWWVDIDYEKPCTIFSISDSKLK